MMNIPEGAASIRRAVAIALLVTLVMTVLGVMLAEALRFGPIDDAYISLRYADNWANGRGLAFNPGEKVEGYTNFLMVALEAIAIKIGFDPVTAMSTIGWISFSLLIFVQSLAVALLLTPGRWWLAIVAGIALGSSPMLVCWGASGMETCLYAALVLASFLTLTTGTFPSWPVVAGVLLALAGMTRPEAVALVPVAVLAAYSRNRDPRVAGSVLGSFLGLYGVYFAIRWWHFGYLLPNTFYAKLDYGGQGIWERGQLYLWDFLRAAPLMSLLGIIAVVMAWRSPRWVRVWSAVLVVQILIVVYEGGDHFAMFRFMVPAVPFLGMLALYWPLELVASKRWPEYVKFSAAVLCCGLVAFSAMRIGRQETRDNLLDLRQLDRFRFEGYMARDWASMGSWLRDNAPEGSSLATIAIGAIGFYSGLDIHDPYGLTDPAIAHRDVDLGSGYAGHEKFDVDTMFERRPTYLLLANQITIQPISETEMTKWGWGAFNEGMVTDPRLATLYRFEPVEIKPDRWMNLHVRRE